MIHQLAGFPFWEFNFDDQGQPEDSSKQEEVVHAIEAVGLTDLFVFSHGWNNDRGTAGQLYGDFFRQFRAVLDAAGGLKRQTPGSD